MPPSGEGANISSSSRTASFRRGRPCGDRDEHDRSEVRAGGVEARARTEDQVLCARRVCEDTGASASAERGDGGRWGTALDGQAHICGVKAGNAARVRGTEVTSRGSEPFSRGMPRRQARSRHRRAQTTGIEQVKSEIGTSPRRMQGQRHSLIPAAEAGAARQLFDQNQDGGRDSSTALCSMSRAWRTSSCK